MRTVSLNGSWELHEEDLRAPLAETAARLTAATDGWLAQPVPGDIHQALIAAGRVPEPLLGDYSLAQVWTEQRSWWLRRRFPTAAAWAAADRLELELHGLDSQASIYFNGLCLGSHRNTFRPFIADLKPHLRSAGDNVLLVRLSAGVEDITEADLKGLIVHGAIPPPGSTNRNDARVPYVRKPQFSFGWDWSPRLATTGITGEALLRPIAGGCIRAVQVTPHHAADGAVAVEIVVTAEWLHFWKTAGATLEVSLTDADGETFTAAREVLLASGLNYLSSRLLLPHPRLWWPNGLGEPHRYQVHASLRLPAGRWTYPAFHAGLRFVELETVGTFRVVVNGRPVFCGGANWIPADALYARVSAARYEQLVNEARLANFTMLRVWGGGLYEPHAFYDACDRHGVLVWQDFMFACAPYPDHLEWFRAEVEAEAEYQTRRLRQYACLVVWCGNNENTWGLKDWWQERTKGGAWCYNYALPAAVRRNCPEIPYWTGSPYGGDASPNSPTVGDRHHWHDCMMHPVMAKRITPEEYDACHALFVSEYGYPGPAVKATIKQYLDGAPFEQSHTVWQHHNNTFEKDTVLAGINEHYRDPAGLTVDEYLLYASLCQGLMYGYSLESFRFRANCHGGLFWMYNDCWGEVGWTIIDYYLRRKPSYYFVKRALAPQRLILRAQGRTAELVFANDTNHDFAGHIQYGYLALDGTVWALEDRRFEAPANARTTVGHFKLRGLDRKKGVYFARAIGSLTVLPATLRLCPTRALALPVPQLAWALSQLDGEHWQCLVSSDVFAHAVHLDLPARAVPEDQYFDLLPGETRVIRIRYTGDLAQHAIRVHSVLPG